MIPYDSFFSSFSLVAVSEMGDKTQLLAFSLAARFRRPLPILGGIFVATIANHLLASYAGSWVASFIEPTLRKSSKVTTSARTKFFARSV